MTKATTETFDYRQSHLEVGGAYVQLFEKWPFLRVMWRLERAVLDELLEAEPLRSRPFRHLDFACGTGRLLSHMEKYSSESVGVDVSSSMLEQASRVTSRSRLIQRDITVTELETPDSFDLITAFRFFPRAQESLRREAMASLARMLKPDGLLVFNNHMRCQSLNGRVRQMTRKVVGAKRNRSHCMSDDEVGSLVREANLAVERCVHLGVLPTGHRRLPVPEGLYEGLERWFMKQRWVRPLAYYHVYMCRKR